MKRLDKILSEAGYVSRKDLKNLIRRGHVKVNGTVVRDSDSKFEDDCLIEIDGEKIELFHRVILLLNKPAGYVTSTDDPRDLTVMDLIPEKYRALNVVPAGRLDKETEGLLVLTNDGDLIHKLISPKSEVKKVYYAEFEGRITEADINAFEQGIILKDGSTCAPAKLSGCGEGKCLIEITQGMYHQVRRMMASRGLHVEYLKRLEEGNFKLGELESGKSIEVNDDGNPLLIYDS